jgi:hypothetical protein
LIPDIIVLDITGNIWSMFKESQGYAYGTEFKQN